MGGGPHRLGLMGGLSVSMSGVKVKMRWNGIYFFFFFFLWKITETAVIDRVVVNLLLFCFFLGKRLWLIFEDRNVPSKACSVMSSFVVEHGHS